MNKNGYLLDTDVLIAFLRGKKPDLKQKINDFIQQDIPGNTIAINRRSGIMKDDPTITRIRTVRHQISEQYQHDVQRIIDHYIQREKHHQGRFTELSESIIAYEKNDETSK